MTPNARLSGKVAIITGGASGIGLETARLFAAEGATVAIADLRGAAEAAASIGDAAFALPLDVADPEAVDRAVTEVIGRQGRVDVLHANASIRVPNDHALQIDLEDWNRILSINLTSVWLCIRAVLPHMASAGGGSIVATSSVSALGGRGSLAYSVAKAGVNMLVRNVAVEFGAANVRVNSVCPGPVRTPMLDEAAAGDAEFEAALANFIDETPLQRIGERVDVAEAVLFLASDASSWITGQVWAIDGGMTAR